MNTEYKAFQEKCIAIVEDHLDDYNFSVTVLAREMGMKGRERAEKLFDLNRCVRNLEIIYREILGGTGNS